jgi:hypothetical protein
MRRAALAVALTTGLVAAATRRASRRPGRPDPIPSQRQPSGRSRPRTELEQLVDGDADLVLAEQEAQDARVLLALDQHLGRAS